MTISNELGPYIFRRKMEKMKPMRKEMDGKVFISSQFWQFSLVNNTISVFFFTLYPDLAGKQLCFSPRKGYKQEKEKY